MDNKTLYELAAKLFAVERENYHSGLDAIDVVIEEIRRLRDAFPEYY